MIEWRWEEGTLSKKIFQFSLQIGDDDMTKCSTQMDSCQGLMFFSKGSKMSLYILRDAHETFILFYFLCRGRISLRLARKRSRSAGPGIWHWHSTISWAHQRIEKRRRAVAINIFCFHSFASSSSSSIVFISFFFLLLEEGRRRRRRESTNPGERQSE